MNIRFFRRTICLTLMLALLSCAGTSKVFAAQGTDTPTLAGKTISILGDSISTYAKVSNNASVNATLKDNKSYYKRGHRGVYRRDTWWQQTIDALGMELLVNNSYSGSSILKPRAGAEAAYIDRCVQLHTNTGEEPDIIAVFMGTNDLLGSSTKLGTEAEIEYEELIRQTGDGYRYAKPETVCEAYAIMLHKMTQRYPNAEIYCLTPLARRNQSAKKIRRAESFNRSVKKIADVFGAYAVDLYHDSGIVTDENFKFYMADNKLHPGPAGMDAITGSFTSALFQNSRYVSKKVYKVSYDLENVIVKQGTKKTVLKGSCFTCDLGSCETSSLNLTVTMKGKDITSQCFKDGKITIEKVTGNIKIQAESDGHPYETSVTAPTCAKKGYTVYSCACGFKYKGNYVDATEKHKYKKGTCTVCGKVQPAPIITRQPKDDKAALGERFSVEVKAEGENLKYRWYYRNKGTKTWKKSSLHGNTYAGKMTKTRAAREVYCVVTDAKGNAVKTQQAKLILKK